MQTVRDAVATPGCAGQVGLLGGHLCLDFVNTVEPRVETVPGRRPREYLVGYPDLIEWAVHVGVVSAEEAKRLMAAAAVRPVEAATVLQRAVALREACY